MSSDIAETAITSPGPDHGAARKALIAFLLLATVMWISIAIGANMRTPGIVGLATTIVGGLLAALLTAAIGGWIALKLAHPWAPPAVAFATSDLEAPYATALQQAIAAQAPISRRMVEQAAWRLPVGAAVGAALWSVLVLLGAPGGLVDYSTALLVGGLLGYGSAWRDATREIADGWFAHGVSGMRPGFSWRRTSAVDPRRFASQGVLPSASEARTSGAYEGVHRGVVVRIAPATARASSGAANSAFTGLLIELETPALTATSMEQLAMDRPQAIALIDQLTTLPGLSKPTCALAGGRLSIAIPESLKPRVYDPPREPGPSAAAAPLARVWQVSGAVLQIADALAAPASPAADPPQP